MIKEIVIPGVIRFPGAVQVSPDINAKLIKAKDNLDSITYGGVERYNEDIVNVDPELIEYLDHVQRVWLECLAAYIDVYDEVVYNISWQESIQFIHYKSGVQLGFHSDTKPAVKPNGAIGDTPQRRVVTSLAYLNDDYVGGDLEFKYWNYKYKPVAGDVIVMPSNFMYTHQSSPLLSGTKVAFLVSWCTGVITEPEAGEYLV